MPPPGASGRFQPALRSTSLAFSTTGSSYDHDQQRITVRLRESTARRSGDRAGGRLPARPGPLLRNRLPGAGLSFLPPAPQREISRSIKRLAVTLARSLI